MEPHLCECGCGKQTNCATADYPKLGYKKGEPFRYLRGHYWRGKNGEAHGSWRGKNLDSQGYVLAVCPDHPNAFPNGRVREHRLVMERHLDRYLEPDEVVHHINGVKTDNRIENLELLGRAEHTALHERYKKSLAVA